MAVVFFLPREKGALNTKGVGWDCNVAAAEEEGGVRIVATVFVVFVVGGSPGVPHCTMPTRRRTVLPSLRFPPSRESAAAETIHPSIVEKKTFHRKEKGKRGDSIELTGGKKERFLPGKPSAEGGEVEVSEKGPLSKKGIESREGK